MPYGGGCGTEGGGLVGGGDVGGGLGVGWVGVVVLFLVRFFFVSSVRRDMLGVRPSLIVLVAAIMVVVVGDTAELMCLGVKRSAFLCFGSDIYPFTI